MKNNKVTKWVKEIIIFMHITAFIIVIFIAILPVRWPEKDDGNYSKNRLLIEMQATTGTNYKIIRGYDQIRDHTGKLFPLYKQNLMTYNEIELVGNVPPGQILYPDFEESDYIVYGGVICVTNVFFDCSGIVPVFFVTDWRPTLYFFNGFSNKSIFPLSFFIFLYFTIFILVVLIISIVTRLMIKFRKGSFHENS
jgi:hypothetical protein